MGLYWRTVGVPEAAGLLDACLAAERERAEDAAVPARSSRSRLTLF